MYGAVSGDPESPDVEQQRAGSGSPSILKPIIYGAVVGLALLAVYIVATMPRAKPAPPKEEWSTACNQSNLVFYNGQCVDRGQFLVDGSDRVFIFENQCPFTIWVAGTMAVTAAVRPELTGWEMAPHTTVAQSIPSEMPSIRYWARTNCKWGTATESRNGINVEIQKFICETGDCGNALNGYGIPCMIGSGLPPATLVEFSLSVKGNDFYDLSNVDGYNVGMKIEPIGQKQSAHLVGKLAGSDASRFDCGRAQCVMDTNKCPPELKKVTSDGTVVCLSICKALWDDKQRSQHPILQDLWTRKTDRGFAKDFLCCDCGEGNGLCEALGSPCTYGCSPFVDNYVDAAYQTRFCTNINGTYLPAWPPASDGQNYAQVFESQCPQAYSWQFNDDQSTFQCHLADYRITFFVKEFPKPPEPKKGKGSK